MPSDSSYPTPRGRNRGQNPRERERERKKEKKYEKGSSPVRGDIQNPVRSSSSPNRFSTVAIFSPRMRCPLLLEIISIFENTTRIIHIRLSRNTKIEIRESKRICYEYMLLVDEEHRLERIPSHPLFSCFPKTEKRGLVGAQLSNYFPTWMESRLPLSTLEKYCSNRANNNG